MALAHLVPPFFTDGEYFDNVYFSLVYLFFSASGVLLPYTKPMKPLISFISTLFGMWAFSMFVFELYHFDMTIEEMEKLSDKEVFNKFLITFVFGIGLFRAQILWQTHKK
jgi:hypothetical protein